MCFSNSFYIEFKYHIKNLILDPVPKRGFKNRFATEYAVINLSDLEKFDNDTVVDIDLLLKEGIVRKELDGLKVLGNGELTKKLTVVAKKFSKSAEEKIQAAGGKIEVK